MFVAESLFNIYYSEIQLFGRPVSLYVLMPVIGIVFIILSGILLARLRGEDVSFIFRTDLFIGTAIAIGILYKDFFITKKSLLPFAFPFALLSVYGIYWLAAYVFDMNTSYMLEQGNLSVMLLPFFSQMSCFHAGCCYGRSYNGFFSVIYSPETYCPVPNIPLFPIRIIEAVAFLLLFSVSLFLSIKKAMRGYIPIFALLNLSVYYGGMALGSIECNTLYINSINFSAILALFLLAAAAAIMIIKTIKTKRRKLK